MECVRAKCADSSLGPESDSACLRSAGWLGPLFFMTPGNRRHMGDPDRVAGWRWRCRTPRTDGRARSVLCRRNGNPISSYAFSSGPSWRTLL